MTDPLAASAPAVRHVDALPTGTRLAEFEVCSLLGVGGFGVVYQAFDHSLLRTVAIKEYLPAALAGRTEGQSLWVRSSSDEQAYQAGLKSFVGEARMLAQFEHPSLVKVFRFWEANNTAYMVMPLYRGMTLKQARAQMRTPPPEAWLRTVLWSVLDALRTLHGSQTLHRDISPDNIFLQDVGPPVLLDLGAARHAINDRDQRHTAVLKVHYAPIEQYADGDADMPQGPWSDLYSLAAVVHGCLCNEAPMPSTLRSIRDRMVPFARVAKTVGRQFGQEYSAAFVAAISQSLALRSEDRPQDIDAFLQTMAMVAPPGPLEHFDFRAQLGDIWVGPAHQPAGALAGPGLDSAGVPLAATLSARPVAPHTALGGAVPPSGEGVQALDLVVPDAEGAAEGANPRPLAKLAGQSAPEPLRSAKPQRAWAWLAGVVLIVAVAGGYGWGRRAPQTAPQDGIITEWAEPAAPTASVPVPQEPAVAATEAAVVEAVAAAAPAGPAPAFVEASDPAAAPRAPVRIPPKASRVPQPEVAREPARAPASAGAPPPLAPSRPRHEAAHQPCVNTNFFTQSACLYRECPKPAFAATPICVEHRRRVQLQADTRFGN
ncbi:hypothetical protein B2J88_20830 [Rhodococcus sp. SRB_17]|nr:hypothetical protein [Rhodococcus sp. SRB_17]